MARPARQGATHESGAVEDLRRLCHDITGRAVAIRHLAELIESETRLPERSAARLTQLEQAAEQVAELCADVLQAPEPAVVLRLDEVAAEAAATYRLVHSSVIQCAAEPALVVASRAQVRRLVGNLLDNACRAAGPCGTVRVTVAEHDGAAWLEVADSGPGFSGAACRSRQVPPGRAGLGLRIVNDVLRDAGGRLTVGRSDLGGAAVSVWFSRRSLPRRAPDPTLIGA